MVPPGKRPMKLLSDKRSWAVLLLAACAGALSAAAPDYDAARQAMVATLRDQGIRNARVLAAMAKVRRHLFVPEAQRSRAYTEAEIPIAHGKVMASPYQIALMTQTLDPQPNTKVLELCTGSGYQTAILAELSSQVYTVERDTKLSEAASERMRNLGCKGVKLGVGEEMKGWPAHAPYQAILVSAAADRVPDHLVEQLADGGRLVITIGRGPEQTLNCMRKSGGKLRVEAVIPLRMSASVTRPRAR